MSTTTPNEMSAHGLELLKSAILSFLMLHPEGTTNAEIADGLGLRSNFEGKQKDYLTYSLLGLLVEEKRVRYTRVSGRRRYLSS
jgi:uncharacterized protein